MTLEMQARAQTQQQSYVNDFAFMVATKNGSGSQTSNAVLIRSLFRMGIPVSGKNLFPSNIKGLPTWYTIRASKDGYIARRSSTEVAVVYNQDTVAEDVNNLPSGGICIISADIKGAPKRDDVSWWEVPVKDILTAEKVETDFRERIANMTYVGVCCYLFDIPLDVAYQALLDQFNQKKKPADMNFAVVKRAYEWAEQNTTKDTRFRFEPMNATQGKILIEGNTAAALGSLFGGLTVAAWYPITPSTSLIDSVLDYRHIRNDSETGELTVAVVQAEDELSAAGMIIGAGWAGARSMTSTSGPGISLMAEFVGLAYFAEIPCVIWDITRTGPSTGLPTRTSQGDLLFLHFLSHGDTRHIVLLPSSVAECFEMGWLSLDLAEQYQTPVFVMSDLDLGMNLWLSDPFKYPEQPISHGKRLDKLALEDFFAQHGEWFRYRDYDGDGVTYRTVPGTDHPRSAYFARGTGHTDMATYSERSEDWVKNLARIERKIANARSDAHLQPIVDYDPAKHIGIISYGSNDPAVVEARDLLASEGIQTNYLRVRSLPLSQQVIDFVLNHDRVYVIENNFDGQMAQIIRMEIAQDTTHMVSLASGDTLPMTAQWIHDHMMSKEN
jgi:2-oxoglutarate ferredoxin oxidoreductase subunit alpha